MRNLLSFLWVALVGLSSNLIAQNNFELVKDINPGGGSYYNYFTEYNNKLYFNAGYYPYGSELWVTDGTTNGTYQLTEINTDPSWGSDPNNLVVFNGLLYFIANEANSVGFIWKTDGTAPTLSKLTQYSMGGYYLTPVGAQLFFQGYDADHGFEVWVTDGSEAGTHMVKDINPGTDGGYGSRFTIYKDKLYFQAVSPTNGLSIWYTDGTELGTSPIVNTSSIIITQLGPMIVFNNKLFFIAEDGTHGSELWISDGTADGTSLFKDIATGIQGSNPTNLTIVGNKLFFSAFDNVTNGIELWVSDGTPQGTQMIKNINSLGSSYPDYFVAYDNHLFFSADDGFYGRELWMSDGTANGTQMAADIYSGSYGGTNLSINAIYNNRLYFLGTDGTNGTELWSYDLNGSTATKVKPSNATEYAPLENTLMMKAFNGSLYFAANFTDKSLELWKLTSQATSVRNKQTTHAHIYPNPAQNEIYINPIKENTLYQIINTTGVIVSSGKITANQSDPIDVSMLPKGFYLFVTDKCQTTFIKK